MSTSLPIDHRHYFYFLLCLTILFFVFSLSRSKLEQSSLHHQKLRSKLLVLILQLGDSNHKGTVLVALQATVGSGLRRKVCSYHTQE